LTRRRHARSSPFNRDKAELIEGGTNLANARDSPSPMRRVGHACPAPTARAPH